MVLLRNLFSCLIGSRSLVIFTLAFLTAVVSICGCAVHYYDPVTSTEHVWGIGHMKMKISQPEESLRAVLKGREVLGVGISLGQEDYGLIAGWHRRSQLDVVDENASIRLEWPSGDIFNVRIGSIPPFIKSEEGQARSN
ncbi:MAG: hypothetical protein JRJ21_04800 [Deltaproteobacteria bacterium]|nr:hypothetical protein [Deltaproteobacteria bacterium]